MAVPKSWSVLTFGIIVVVMLISAILSGHAAKGIIGDLDMDTVGFGLLAFILLYAIPLIITTRSRAAMLIGTFLISISASTLFFITRLSFGVRHLTLGVFSDLSANLSGSWNDIGILAGLVFIVSLCAHELIPTTRVVKNVLRAMLVLSFLTLTIVNNLTVWIIIGVAMLLLFVYSFSSTLGKRQTTEEKTVSYRVPVLPLAGIIVCVCFILIALRTNPYNFLGSLPQMSYFNRYNVNLVEGRPSFGSTWSVGVATLKDKHIFGVGPNRFSTAWNLHKDPQVNQFPFWNIDFNYGYGIVPSSFITLGIPGVLAWLAFLVLFLFSGVMLIFKRYGDKTSQFLVAGSFLGAAYLWFFAIVYTPGAVVYLSAIILTGIMLSVKEQAFKNGYKTINFISDPRIAFGFVLGLVLVLIGSVVSFYWIGTVAASNAYMLKGIQNINAGDVNSSEININNSLRIRPTDTGYRLLSSVGLARAQSVLQTSTGDAATAQLKTIMQSTLSIAAAAVSLDGSNYQNWINLGRVYQFITAPEADDAYGEGKKAYTEAATRNPSSPYISLLNAQLEEAHGDKEKAKELVIEAINKKPDYLDAYYLLSQMFVDQGNTDDAVNTLAAAVQVDSTNSVSWFQLGVLYYSSEDYDNALIAFQQAVTYSPEFANARYFGGLTLDKLGNEEDALKVFELLKQSNPDNKEIDTIIANIKAGRPAVPDNATTPPASTIVSPSTDDDASTSSDDE